MADVTDKITDTRNATRPVTTTVSSPRSTGGGTLSCASLTGWSTDSKVHFVTYQIDSNSNPVAGTQLDCYAIRSGNDLTSFTVVDGTDTGHSIGDVVEMLPTAAWGQDLADALTEEHDRTGKHTDIDADSIDADALGATLLGLIYPIGSVYINAAVATNPNTLLGFGTWAAYGAGRVLVGLDAGQTEFDTLGETGGAKTHTLTSAEMPAHTHGQQAETTGNNLSPFRPTIAARGSDLLAAGSTDSTGGGGAHNNLQPYIVVYMWRRTA